MRKLLFLLVALALAASAADVSGTWKGTIETPGGSFENTFVLKAEGAKLTGTLQGGPGGEMKIDEGKVGGGGGGGGGDMPPMELNCKRVK